MTKQETYDYLRARGHSVHSNTLCGILPVNSNYLFTTAILSPVIARFV